ncbi:hypothetical protein DFH08DRAFT_964878 [Mycena albidolilacea]|uniref:Uncharacterized protein n=1 Tax=Mycena albidolilacea TaxID=1033008 RepID=A0AAD6ZSL3_9AGAR|nr:hypothetical protein DFH08DRAFT_964878 [Mycena albidolilacea]
MYHSLCPPAYNDETIYLINNDPQCQIVISTVAFTNGINARKLLDSILLGFAKTVDIMWQEKGRVGREPETVARGVVLVQLSSISAAIKQLEGPASPPKAPAKRRKAVILKKPRAPMEAVKAQFLVEKKCYYAFLSSLYGNPPLELTTLDCVAAKRPLPCSLCLPRSKKTITYTAPASAPALPRLTPPRSSANNDSVQPKKLKLKKKNASQPNLPSKIFENNYVSMNNSLVDSVTTHLRFSCLLRFKTASSIKRDEARKETNRKARATRKANKRKAAAAISDYEDADEPDSEHDKDDDDLHDEHEPPRSESPSNDLFLAALLPKSKSRGRKRQALENIPTNTSTRRPREQLQKAAEVSKDYGPQYRPRVRR